MIEDMEGWEVIVITISNISLAGLKIPCNLMSHIHHWLKHLFLIASFTIIKIN